MTELTPLWSLLLLLTCAVLLALPFYPAWSEWRRPRDQQTWPLPPQLLQDPEAATHTSVRLAPGAQFERLQAGHIVLGTGTVPASASVVPGEALHRWQPPPGARPWGVRGWHIGHALDIAQAEHVPHSLVVRGPLQVHGPAWIEGDIKTRDQLRLGPGCRVQGNLFSEGDIRLGPGCRVSGLVMAEGRLQLAPGVVIGSPQQPVSVCADVIEAEGPVLIHGSVHARIRGEVLTPAPVSPTSSPKDTPT